HRAPRPSPAADPGVFFDVPLGLRVPRLSVGPAESEQQSVDHRGSKQGSIVLPHAAHEKSDITLHTITREPAFKQARGTARRRLGVHGDLPPPQTAAMIWL